MADTTNRLAGVASMMIDGVAYSLAGDFTYSTASVSRETLKGLDGVHGYKEMPRQPFISATLRDGQGVTVDNFTNMTNVTLSIQLANGKLIIGRNMWTVGEGAEVKSEEGTFEVRFEGFQGSVTEN